jgi:hypothetical protein
MDVQVRGATDVTTSAASGVPADGTVTAVAMNVTATNVSASSFLTVWPTGAARPVASNLNFVPGQSVPNLVEVPVSTSGRVSVFNHTGSADVIFDVAGYYTNTPAAAAGLLRSLAPSRIMDTRLSSPGCPSACTTLGPNGSLTLQVTGSPDITTHSPSGVPNDGSAGAVVVNVTVTNPTAPSFLTAFPTGSPLPTVSNLNFVPGQTVPNRAIVKLGTGGQITLYNHDGNADVVVDIGGYYTSASASGGSGGYTPLAPARILDTRQPAGSCTPSCATLTPGGSMRLQVANSSDITTLTPSGVPSTLATTPPAAVVLNVTATNPTAASFLTIYPGGTQPVISDLNVVPGSTVANLVVVKLAPDGSITIFNNAGNVDVVVDVEGWFS